MMVHVGLLQYDLVFQTGVLSFETVQNHRKHEQRLRMYGHIETRDFLLPEFLKSLPESQGKYIQDIHQRSFLQ